MAMKKKKKVRKTRRKSVSLWQKHRSKLISSVLAIFAFSAIAYIFHHHRIQAQRSFVPTQAAYESKVS